MSTPAAEELAREHQRDQQAMTRVVIAAIAGAWAQMDPDDLIGSWFGDVGLRVVAAVVAAQLRVAQEAIGYVAEAIGLQGARSDPVAEVVPDRLVAVASDGRDLLTLLSFPLVRLLQALGLGVPLPEASRRAHAELTMIARTQVQDTGRVAAGLAMVTQPRVRGYERVVTLPACGRCIVLAGRLYSYSEGFLRHPQCDCQMVPVTIEQYESERPGNTPKRLFEEMTPEQQARAFGRAGARAIRDGADLGQVVNARRGMTTAGGRRYTREGTTQRGLAGKRLGQMAKAAGSPYQRSRVPRLMPEQIYAEADREGWDRDELLRQLERFGYLSTSARRAPARPRQTAPVRNSRPVAASRAATPPRGDIPSRPVRPRPPDPASERIGRSLREDLTGLLGHDVEVDLARGSPQTVQVAADVLRRLARSFPQANLTSVRLGETSEMGGLSTYALVRDNPDGGAEMLLSAFWFARGREALLAERLDDDVAKSWCPPGWGLEAMIIHEFGHVLDEWTAIGWRDRGDGATTTFREDLLTHLANDGVDITNTRRLRRYIRDRLGEYANKDELELFANAFADYIVNGENADRLSRLLVERLLAALGRRRG